jgi:hypothetical protein
MRHPKLAVIVLAVCASSAVLASRVAHAGAFSIHPFACNLVQNSSPNYPGFNSTSIGHSNATFTNLSGTTAFAMCPVVFQPGFNTFQVSTTAGVTNCYVKVMATGGGATIFFGSHSGNQWTIGTTVNSGTYAAEVECNVPNGQGLYHLVNF